MTSYAVNAHVNRALAKAVTDGLYRLVERETEWRYHVPSTTRSETKHLVTLFEDGHMMCSCEAGSFLPYCVHRGAVQVSRWVDQGFEVEVARTGEVYVLERKLAAPVAYDPTTYAGLIQDVPPPEAYEAESHSLNGFDGELER